MLMFIVFYIEHIEWSELDKLADATLVFQYFHATTTWFYLFQSSFRAEVSLCANSGKLAVSMKGVDGEIDEPLLLMFCGIADVVTRKYKRHFLAIMIYNNFGLVR